MKKVLVVFGTRPEAIKMAPLVLELEKRREDFDTIVCVTGQHREMLDQVLRIFDIHPAFDLNIMQKGQDLFDITTRVLLGLRDILRHIKPDIVLVHGDTTTSTAAALAAFYEKIAVGHVEAGLRTYNKYSPWPEEINRQLTSRIASYQFAPTPLSRKNLLAEQIPNENIFVTGNTVIDALQTIVTRFQNNERLAAQTQQLIMRHGYDTRRLEQRKLILITGHRRENFGEGFISMCKAILYLTQRYTDFDFVYPMHLNPNVRKPIKEVFGSAEDLPNNIFFIEPLEYLEFVFLMKHAYIVLTDSGGIQEEAPGLGIPVLVMRETTERPEAIDAGTVKLVGTNYQKIVDNTIALIEDDSLYKKMSQAANPYGDGKASMRIADILHRA